MRECLRALEVVREGRIDDLGHELHELHELTAMANALRVGDHLLERLGATTTTTPLEVPA